MLAGQIGARGRVRTCTGDVLDVVSLLLDYASKTNWILQPVMLRQNRFTKMIRRLLRGGKVAMRKHSQSPVLPWARLAYDACLSAGSTAMLAHGHRYGRSPKEKLEPPPGIAPSSFAYRANASLNML